MGQHYVPQHHLRQFATPSDPGKIWVYDKCSGECKLLPIRNVAQSSDFYKEEDERALSEKIEGPVQGPLEQLRSGQQIDQRGREAIALYLDSMIKRVPHFRERMRDALGPVTEDLLEKYRRDCENLAPQWNVTPAQLLVWIDNFERYFRSRNISLKDNLIRYQWFSPVIFYHIFTMTWRVVRTGSQNRFLTADNPVFFDEGYGLKRPHGEFSFPFASDIVLHGSWQKAEWGHLTFVDVRPAYAKEFNRRVVFGADRFVFYDQKAKWVRELARKPYLRLNRIRW